MEHQVDLIFTCGRVGPIQNKVFMKTVIAAIQQHARYAFAFFFEPRNGKRVASFKLLAGGIVQIEHSGDNRVLYIITHRVDKKGLSGVQSVDGRKAFAFGSRS